MISNKDKDVLKTSLVIQVPVYLNKAGAAVETVSVFYLK